MKKKQMMITRDLKINLKIELKTVLPVIQKSTKIELKTVLPVIQKSTKIELKTVLPVIQKSIKKSIQNHPPDGSKM